MTTTRAVNVTLLNGTRQWCTYTGDGQPPVGELVSVQSTSNPPYDRLVRVTRSTSEVFEAEEHALVEPA